MIRYSYHQGTLDAFRNFESELQKSRGEGDNTILTGIRHLKRGLHFLLKIGVCCVSLKDHQRGEVLGFTEGRGGGASHYLRGEAAFWKR